MVSLRGIAALPPTFTFQLQLTYNGIVAVSDPVSGQAVATVEDEVSGSSVPGHGTVPLRTCKVISSCGCCYARYAALIFKVCSSGLTIGTGESVQSKLDAFANIGRVSVSSTSFFSLLPTPYTGTHLQATRLYV